MRPTPKSSPANRQRLVLVYNPRSSGFKTVEDEVITPLRRLKNLTLLKYTVQPTNVDDNATQLSTLLHDGDLVLVAGGDGTATIALNGIVLSKKSVRLAVLGYGNFNDFARTLGRYDFNYVLQHYFATDAPTRQLYPLDIRVNGEHWRYAASYLTIGLFAESTQVFDQPEVRTFLQKHGKNFFFSVLMLARWYFTNRRREFIPQFKLNGQVVAPRTTDLMVVSSKSVAKVMRGGKVYLSPDKFLLTTTRLGSFWRLIGFMLRSIFYRLPGQITKTATLQFARPAQIELQAEGEYQKFSNVKTIEINKVAGVECLIK